MRNKRGSYAALNDKIARFVKERDWEQYHTPKNLAMSIAIEAGELMEHFQWLTNEESEQLLRRDKKKFQEVKEELADIAVYVLDFCSMYGVDLQKEILAKLKKNAKKYPVHKAKGNAKKYTEL